mmetsp:Transcript_22907/g.25257  ORF Transcript_22907/g.25257 Transcript_22907/m.25257 type:complete len:181 (+) Transcript_22907:127-669(+)
MKLSLIISAIAATATTAFAPSCGMRTTSSLKALDRRNAVGQIIVTTAAIVAAAPSIASADGAISMATTIKAKVIYGGRVYALKDAVSAGDFAAVAKEKNAFILFNSGAYSRTKDKPKKAVAIESTNAIFAAIRSKDQGALKSAYDKYLADNNITEFPDVESDSGQGYASDFGYTVRTKAG